MGIFMKCISKQKYYKICNKNYLMLLPWCITCCPCSYYPDSMRFWQVLEWKTEGCTSLQNFLELEKYGTDSK